MESGAGLSRVNDGINNREASVLNRRRESGRLLCRCHLCCRVDPRSASHCSSSRERRPLHPRRWNVDGFVTERSAMSSAVSHRSPGNALLDPISPSCSVLLPLRLRLRLASFGSRFADVSILPCDGGILIAGTVTAIGDLRVLGLIVQQECDERHIEFEFDVRLHNHVSDSTGDVPPSCAVVQRPARFG